MDRREVVKLLSGTAVLPMVHSELFAIFRQLHPPPTYQPRTLTRAQQTLVAAVAERIIPTTDTPGAKAAGVDRFIDVVLSDWATAEERAKFIEGINLIETGTVATYGRSFVDLDEKHQEIIVLNLDADIIFPAVSNWKGQRSLLPPDDLLRWQFFRSFKYLTLHGYYTSQIGYEQELKMMIIPGAQHGCETPQGHESAGEHEHHL